MRGHCTGIRNEHSKDTIREDFADSIKELDQKNTAAKGLNSKGDLKDYSEIARSLPVFADVKSRG